MRYARGQFAEAGEFLSRNDLVLGTAQILKRGLELIVLAAQFRREFLDQVQALYFQGVTAEHFQRRSHFCHFVPAADVDFGFKVALRHGAHAVRQRLQSGQQQSADKQPGDKHGSHDADTVDRHEQDTAGADGVLGRAGGGRGAFLRAIDEALDLCQQSGSEIPVLDQKLALPIGQRKLLGAQLEHALPRKSQVAQPTGGRGVAAHGGDDVVEALPHGLQGRVVRDVEGVDEQLDAQRAGVAEAGPGSPRRAGQLRLKIRQLRAQVRGAFAQDEPFSGRGLNGVDVGDQRAALEADTVEAFAAVTGQIRELNLEGLTVRLDFPFDGGQFLEGAGAGETRRCDRQRAAPLGDGERSGKLGQTGFVDLDLGVSHTVERQPRHEARDERERDGRADAGIELDRKAGEHARGLPDPLVCCRPAGGAPVEAARPVLETGGLTQLLKQPRGMRGIR